MLGRLVYLSSTRALARGIWPPQAARSLLGLEAAIGGPSMLSVPGRAPFPRTRGSIAYARRAQPPGFWNPGPAPAGKQEWRQVANSRTRLSPFPRLFPTRRGKEGVWPSEPGQRGAVLCERGERSRHASLWPPGAVTRTRATRRCSCRPRSLGQDGARGPSAPCASPASESSGAVLWGPILRVCQGRAAHNPPLRRGPGDPATCGREQGGWRRGLEARFRGRRHRSQCPTQLAWKLRLSHSGNSRRPQHCRGAPKNLSPGALRGQRRRPGRWPCVLCSHGRPSLRGLSLVCWVRDGGREWVHGALAAFLLSKPGNHSLAGVAAPARAS